jgi:hypothetical protein
MLAQFPPMASGAPSLPTLGIACRCRHWLLRRPSAIGSQWPGYRDRAMMRSGESSELEAGGRPEFLVEIDLAADGT